MRTLARKGAVVSAVALALVASACGGDDDDSGGGTGDETSGAATGAVTVYGCTPENPFIPTNTNETCGGDVLDAITAKLVRYDATTAEPIMNVAESIESDDATNWTVKLKPGWKFHDGTDVTADSFVKAWNWASYGPNAQLNSYFFDPIEGYADLQSEDPDGEEGPQTAPEPAATEMSGLKVVSPTEFTIKTSAPTSNLPVRLGYTAFSPLPESFFADNGAAFGANPIGAGPYKFVSYTEGDSMKLEANADYAGENKPQIQDLTFKIYQELDAAYVDLVAGNLDVLDTIPPSALAGDKFRTDLGDRVVEQASGTIQTMTFPTYADAQLANPEIRKAISQAIDRETIVKNVFAGSRIPAGGFVSPIVDGYKEGVCGDSCVFDADKAKAALDAAGGFTGTLTIGYNADGGHKEWVDATCISITNALGIDCQGKPYVDFATFRADINDRKMTGAFRTGWQMDYPSIENFLAPIYGTDAGSNDGPYSNPEFDQLLTEAAAAPSTEEANTIYQDAEAILVEDFPAIPLWYVKTVGGYSENVNAVQFNPFGVPDWTSITVK